jgi:hypothetical protein
MIQDVPMLGTLWFCYAYLFSSWFHYIATITFIINPNMTDMKRERGIQSTIYKAHKF